MQPHGALSGGRRRRRTPAVPSSPSVGGDASGYGYVRRDRDAAAQLFRSQPEGYMVGEDQIHCQVRDAWRSASAGGHGLNRFPECAAGVEGAPRDALGPLAERQLCAVQLARRSSARCEAARWCSGRGDGDSRSPLPPGVRAAVGAIGLRAAQALARSTGEPVNMTAAGVRWPGYLLLCSTASPHPW